MTRCVMGRNRREKNDELADIVIARRDNVAKAYGVAVVQTGAPTPAVGGSCDAPAATIPAAVRFATAEEYFQAFFNHQ
jgi:hypothetical protein